jgi:preprotein translocase subunit SecA
MLCGMTGTAAEVATELRRVYDLDMVKVPPNKPNQRRYFPSQCWPSPAERWRAVADRAVDLSRAGRAVLIGTRSVEASEHLGTLLTERGLEHTVLNARHDQHEAEAVARAGLPGRITVATNMAGRGTDIRPPKEVLSKGGLHVILTEFHESRRIDRQLFGRSARQGEPGTVEAMVSSQDELILRHVPRLAALSLRLSRSRTTIPQWLLWLLVYRTQASAEQKNRATRMVTLKQDRRAREMLGFAGKVR